jgi:DNA-binding transcriptional LysR family regulator
LLTLRQIEVIRAIMLAGTVKGAADLLGVSAPGISRVMKYTENQLGVRMFSRSHGRFVPTNEALGIFNQINEVFSKVENLQYSIDRLKKGEAGVFSFASVPSIAQHVLPRAVARLRKRFPELRMNINILKIEEAIDYLLLKKGEMVAMSYKIDHPGLVSHQLAAGSLMAVVPEGHPLAERKRIPIAMLHKYPASTPTIPMAGSSHRFSVNRVLKSTSPSRPALPRPCARWWPTIWASAYSTSFR